MVSSQFKFGVIGAGYVADKYLAALRKIPKNSVVAACSRRPKSVRALARRWKISTVYTDMERLCGDPEVQAVIVAVPNYLHKKATLLAAENGKHIICTKPLAMNAAEALEMVKAVERAGAIHCYAENHVFMPPLLKAQELILRKKALGRIYWTRAATKHPGPHSPWFCDPRQAGGGALIDLGCHLVEFGRIFIGKAIPPKEAFCWGDTLVHKINTEDTAIGLVRHRGGQINQIEASWGYRGSLAKEYEISGVRGTIKVIPGSRLSCCTERGEKSFVSNESCNGDEWSAGFVGEFAHFVESIRAGQQPSENFRDGYVVNAVIDALYSSMKSRRWEKVSLKL